MSKRREQYEKAIERLSDFLAIFLKEKTIPSKDELLQEIGAIPSLRSMEIQVSLPNDPKETEEGFFFLLNEEYERYNDVLPSAIRILLLPQSQDDPKELNRFLTIPSYTSFNANEEPDLKPGR
ncbi:MAG: hypothetical protein AB1656_25710 [Candidatus Omnitrophota bacterium]